MKARKSKVGILTATVIGAWLALTPHDAFATKFANQFAEFELPPQWQCNLEGAEWVCQSTEEAKKKDAIIVLAAKLKGDQDSLDQYMAYLKNPKTYVSVQGKQTTSTPKYAKSVNLNNHAWIDSLHENSEIPGFFTRYLATVKQDIGVLITYSINKNKYQLYVQDFENMVRTLKVFRKAGGLNVAPANGNIFANTQIPAGITESNVFPGGSENAEQAPKPVKKKDDTTLYLIIGGAAIAFILWRKRQSG